MRRIDKGAEPEKLREWKRRNANGRYADLTENERMAVRLKCTQEQYYLCAYCCQKITGSKFDTVNEHVEAQALAPNRTLAFDNIVASCKTGNQCDASHKSRQFSLTPLMAECETELKFKISGRVEGLTDRAKRTVEVLNLGDSETNNRALIEKRKQLSQNLLWTNGINPTEGLEDDELLESLAEDILRPKDGKLESFAPIVANILKSWTSK